MNKAILYGNKGIYSTTNSVAVNATVYCTTTPIANITTGTGIIITGTSLRGCERI